MLRIGLLGASRIAKDALIIPAAERGDVEITSVAARDVQRAQTYAQECQIPHASHTYQQLVESNQIDLIYIGLPPGQHCEWALRALDHGKHVLCEKPFAMNADEACQMVNVAAERPGQLIEAFHYRFHPMMHRLLTVLDSGIIGKILNLTAHFNIAVSRHSNEFRYHRKVGGGALMDLGCYPVHWVRTVIGEEPEVTAASSRYATSFDDPPAQVDIETTASLQFPSGVEANISCSMDEALSSEIDARLQIVGSEGEIIAENPLQPALGSALKIRTTRSVATEPFSSATFPYQLDHVIRQLQGKVSPLTGGVDAIANMKIIDAIRCLSFNNKKTGSDEAHA